MPLKTPHAAPRRLVVATGNAGKLREFRALLNGLGYEILGQNELGVQPLEETGTSFLENALLKARHARDVTGLDALADDSGLEVDALGGSPGVYSARFAGPGADDDANNAKLLAALHAAPARARTARYRCVLALLAQGASRPLISEGVWEGTILEAARGRGGFGYDPYFWLPDLGATAAELEPGVKNRLSHRARAFAALRRALEERA